MTGPKAPRPQASRTATRTRVRWLLALSATVALGAGLGTAGQAQVSTETAALAPTVAATTPPALRFQPSAEAAAEAAAELAAPLSTPLATPATTPLGTGSASYYADRFHGQRTASGEAFDNRDYTAAHRTLPFGSRVRVTNPATGASVVVRINDRGPFTRGREIDVSRAAAEDLGLIRPGHARVDLELLED